jgi:hypothetical protein
MKNKEGSSVHSTSRGGGGGGSGSHNNSSKKKKTNKGKLFTLSTGPLPQPKFKAVVA